MKPPYCTICEAEWDALVCPEHPVAVYDRPRTHGYERRNALVRDIEAALAELQSAIDRDPDAARRYGLL